MSSIIFIKLLFHSMGRWSKTGSGSASGPAGTKKSGRKVQLFGPILLSGENSRLCRDVRKSFSVEQEIRMKPTPDPPNSISKQNRELS